MNTIEHRSASIFTEKVELTDRSDQYDRQSLS